MTLQQLKNEIAALGFEGEIESGDSFIFAVKRAISVIYTERTVHKTFTLYQRNPRPDSHIAKFYHDGGANDSFTFIGGAYFFTASGNGRFTLTDSDGVHEYAFNSQKATFRGLIRGEGVLSFTGDLCYTVYDLCHFTELTSSDPEDIEYTPFTVYPLDRLIPDYLGPYGNVCDGVGRRIEGSSICSGKLSVPYSYEGRIDITYRYRPTFDPDVDPDTELGLDSETEHLLPLLAAAYVWLDDDPEKAQYYMSMYRDGMAALKLYSPRCTDAEYEDVTGWAI